MGGLPYLEALLATTPVGRFPRALPIDCLGMCFVFFGMRGVRARSCGWARGPGSIWGGLALLWQNPVGKSRRFIAPRRAHAHAHAHVGCLGPATNFHASTCIFPVKLSASFPAITSIFSRKFLEITTHFPPADAVLGAIFLI